jgi:hypothetical protein
MGDYKSVSTMSALPPEADIRRYRMIYEWRVSTHSSTKSSWTQVQLPCVDYQLAKKRLKKRHL